MLQTLEERTMQQIDWQKISGNECYPIKWKFNYLTAAWGERRLGGAVYSFSQEPARAHSRKIISEFCVIISEELLTNLCDVEASIKSLPLTYSGPQN
ncbi:hypothetical protein CDAR_266881 [Caerostris darwini]|uniref:Uncharacterized protein n=1 Tax=Caerostris darwini TaxID=1538125 RepID=A0AAV4R659_9ARAC|nr:hypothetical protein CDAR_266881 [Caerostris darwini]